MMGEKIWMSYNVLYNVVVSLVIVEYRQIVFIHIFYWLFRSINTIKWIMNYQFYVPCYWYEMIYYYSIVLFYFCALTTVPVAGRRYFFAPAFVLACAKCSDEINIVWAHLHWTIASFNGVWIFEADFLQLFSLPFFFVLFEHRRRQHRKECKM